MDSPTHASTVAFRQPKNWLRWAVVVLAAVGWWLSFDLFRIAAGAPATNPLLESACGAEAARGGSLDCASVLASHWAYVGRTAERTGTPVSAFGMGYFAFVGLWYLLVGPPTRARRGWHLLIGGVVALGLLVSFVMLRAMAFELRQWCLGCVATHAINAVIGVLTLVAFPWRREGTAVPTHPGGRLVLAGLVACGGAFVLHLAFSAIGMLGGSHARLYEAYQGIVSDPAYARWKYERQPLVEIPLRATEVADGEPNGRHVVVAFVDFQCASCRLAHQTLASVRQKHGGALRVIYRHYPQDPACNPHEQTTGHPYACQAAFAAEAARALGGDAAFAQMRGRLYERQSELGTPLFEKLAADIGLDPAAFARATASDAVRTRVLEDIETAAAIGVTSTPVIFLDGRRLEHWRSEAVWDALLGAGDAPSADAAGGDEKEP